MHDRPAPTSRHVTPADTFVHIIESGALHDYEWYMNLNIVPDSPGVPWSVSFDDAVMLAAKRYTITHATVMDAVRLIASTSPRDVTENTALLCWRVMAGDVAALVDFVPAEADEVIQRAAWGTVRYP